MAEVAAFEEVEVGEADFIKCPACNGEGKQNIAGMKLECMKCKGKGVDSDSRKRLDPGALSVDESDATLNVCVAADGKLTSLNDDGLQYLYAGLRVNTGVISGRYLVELRVAELPSVLLENDSAASASGPRQLVRFGVSTVGSSPLLSGDSMDCAFFDTEGFYTHDQQNVKIGQPFGGNHVMGLLINSEPGPARGSQSLSLFLDGRRASHPIAFPEALRGKVLIPTITYKNVALQVNLGRDPWCPLSFKCRTLPDAVVSDVQTFPSFAPDTKSEVLFPIGLPDTGVFDWVDCFLARNPKYMELSERKLLEWASKSGIQRKKGYVWKKSLDTPGIELGIPAFDDAQRSLLRIAPGLRRNFVVTELKANLIPEERKALLAKFNDASYSKIAVVLVGEPDEMYKALVQNLLLAYKRQKAEERLLQNSVEEAKKKLMLERARRRSFGVGSAVVVPAATADAESLEFTEEERAAWRCPSDVPDLTPENLADYTKFALPAEDEGFTEVRYFWQPASDCAEILQKYIMDRRLTTKLDSLKPGEWFNTGWSNWAKALQEWRKLHAEWKSPPRRKAIQAKRKEIVEKDGGTWSDLENLDPNTLDVANIEDIKDIGNGEPLFSKFEYEDWVLLGLRYEMHILCHSFKDDCGDPEHPGIPEPHLGFYYKKYFKKLLVISNCKVATTQELFQLMGGAKNSVSLNETISVLEPLLPKDEPLESFVKFIEDMRRDRERIIDAGDEVARLKFARPAQTAVSAAKAAPVAVRPPGTGVRPVLAKASPVVVRTPIRTIGSGRLSTLAGSVLGRRIGDPKAKAATLPVRTLRPTPVLSKPGQARPVGATLRTSVGQLRPIAVPRPTTVKARSSAGQLRPATMQPRLAVGTVRTSATAPARLATKPLRPAAPQGMHARPRPVSAPSRPASAPSRPASASPKPAIGQARPTIVPRTSASQPAAVRRPVPTVPARGQAANANARAPPAHSAGPPAAHRAAPPQAGRPSPSPRATIVPRAPQQWQNGPGYGGPQKRPAPPSWGASPAQRPRAATPRSSQQWW